MRVGGWLLLMVGSLIEPVFLSGQTSSAIADSSPAASLETAPAASDILAPIASVAVGDQKSVQLERNEEKFQRVDLQPGQAVGIALQFPATLAGGRLVVEPMDGGLLSLPTAKPALDATGAFAFTFQPGNHAGLYRVHLHQGAADCILQFYVNGPSATPAP